MARHRSQVLWRHNIICLNLMTLRRDTHFIGNKACLVLSTKGIGLLLMLVGGVGGVLRDDVIGWLISLRTVQSKHQVFQNLTLSSFLRLCVYTDVSAMILAIVFHIFGWCRSIWLLGIVLRLWLLLGLNFIQDRLQLLGQSWVALGNFWCILVLLTHLLAILIILKINYGLSIIDPIIFSNRL